MIYPRVAICGVARDDSRRILLIRRGPGAINGAGEWSIPGGKLDPGETMAFGAGRELFEETGVEADEMRDTGVYTEDLEYGNDLHFVTHFFQAMRWRGDARIVEPHKHDGLLWMPERELLARVSDPDPAYPIFGPTGRFVSVGGLEQLID